MSNPGFLYCAPPRGAGHLGLYRLRIARIANRLKLQMEAQGKERKRSAQELHDTLLQGFIGIGLKIDALANDLPDSLLSIQERLRKILLQSQHNVSRKRAPRSGNCALPR